MSRAPRKFITVKTRAVLEVIDRMAIEGADKEDVEAAAGIGWNRLNDYLATFCGSCAWPQRIPAEVWEIPVVERKPRQQKPVQRSGVSVVTTTRRPENVPEPIEFTDPCGFCGVRPDVHDQFGCKRYGRKW